MKGFMGTFLICLVLCLVAVYVFAGLLFSNLWADIIVIALLLAISITVFINHDSRIEELEKKIQQMQNEKNSGPEE